MVSKTSSILAMASSCLVLDEEDMVGAHVCFLKKAM